MLAFVGKEGAKQGTTVLHAMQNKDLEAHISATYRWLRYWIAIVAFALPLVLWLGGLAMAGLPLQGSMSAYYHASDLAGQGPYGAGVMRNEFVGTLVAVGAILVVYQGVTKFEDWALNLAGVFAIGVAFLPMPWPPESGGVFSPHGICAVAFFLCIAYVSIFRAADTLPMLPDPTRRDQYRRKYRILGWAMPISPLAAWVLSSFLHATGSLVFFVEFLGIYVFAIYWLIKSLEIREINARPSAARRFRTKPHGLKQAFSPIELVESD